MGEYQDLDLEGLEREYNDDIGMVNTMETDYIDSIVSLKNMDDAIEVLEQGVARRDSILGLVGNMRKLSNLAIVVHNNNTQSDISDNEGVFAKQQRLLEQYALNVTSVLNNADGTYDQYFKHEDKDKTLPRFLAYRDSGDLQHIVCETLTWRFIDGNDGSSNIVDLSGVFDGNIKSKEDAKKTFDELCEVYEKIENKRHSM